ncbi:MAG: extracellular solute-binding protein, partial [Spirochaetia bacterium]|nr:extracellular solute-binding protein [Spirochaetia bacterium]
QIRLFRSWLIKNGYDDVGVEIDAANTGTQKTIMSGVAGAAADLFDFGGTDFRFVQDMGLLSDLSDLPERLHFKTNNYYPGLYDQLFRDGKRYAYSANVAVNMFIANKLAFRKAHIPLPPYRWTHEEFERIGRDYVESANKGESRRLYFFANNNKYFREVLRRSAGVSWFNESLTKSSLDDPRHIAVLGKIKKWVDEMHILPSEGDVAALSTQLVTGFGGAESQYFHKGYFATLFWGSWALVGLRELGGEMELAAIEPPHAGFPTTDLGGRGIMIYEGSQHKEEAALFIKFLSSEEYNLSQIESGDAQPPDPSFLDRQEFLHPKRFPNEWEVMEKFARASKEIAQCREYSPFANFSESWRAYDSYYSGYMSGVYTAHEMAKQSAEAMNRGIVAYVKRHPLLQKSYEEALERQKKIDVIKAENGKIPLELVDNPVLKRFYRETGMGI